MATETRYFVRVLGVIIPVRTIQPEGDEHVDIRFEIPEDAVLLGPVQVDAVGRAYVTYSQTREV